MVFFEATRQVELPTKDLLSWIFDDIRYDPDKPVLHDAADPTRTISANQARTFIRKLVAGLQEAGLQRGDCVLIHSFNDIYYPVLVLGIIAAGGIFAGTNPAYTPYELSHHIKTAKVKFILSEPEILEPLLAAAKENSITPSKLWIFHPHPSQSCPDGYTSYTTLLQHGERDWVRFNDANTCANTCAMRLFTSGTSGLPKAAISSHMNFIAQHELMFEASAVGDYDHVNLFALPMFHAAIAPRAHISTFKMRNGDKVYIMRRFDLEKFLQCLDKYKVTDLTVVPPMAVALIMSPLSKKYSMKSVKQGLVGAAPLRPEPQARLKAMLGQGATMTQVWGMTETTCVCSRFEYPESDDTGSVGYLLPNINAKLVDDEGKDISKYDVRGELCVKGPLVIQGYFENEKANKESFDDEGFFHTGDVAYCDSKTKKWYIVDRKKELIKVRGFQVAPPELEGLLLGHPDIVDAAVIGVPGGEGSELPRAYVVRKPGTDEKALTEEMVKEWVGSKLASYKRLEGGVKFVDAIPKNASGKILKRVLREELQRELKKSGPRL